MVALIQGGLAITLPLHTVTNTHVHTVMTETELKAARIAH
jgi:hypothetical protein